MAVILKFNVPAMACDLGTIARSPADAYVTMKLEPSVPIGPKTVPFFWIYEDDPDPIIDRLRDRPSVQTVEVVERVGQATLIALEWNDEADAVFGPIRACTVTSSTPSV